MRRRPPRNLCFAGLINANGKLRQFSLFEKKNKKKGEKMLLSYKNLREEEINAELINTNDPKFKVLKTEGSLQMFLVFSV